MDWEGNMEKIKDFLYDISDLFFSLLIIAIIFIVVSWKLTDTMQVSWFSNFGSDNTVADFNDDSRASLDDINKVVDTIPDTTIVEVVPEDETTPEEIIPEVVEAKDVTFTVSPGSPGYRIATELEAQGLIEDVDTFIQTLDDLSLGNKLRAGNFNLNTGMTVEEIINVLAGQ